MVKSKVETFEEVLYEKIKKQKELQTFQHEVFKQKRYRKKKEEKDRKKQKKNIISKYTKEINKDSYNEYRTF